MSPPTPVEIERKFLVDRAAFLDAQPNAKARVIAQGYWSSQRLPFFFNEMIKALQSLHRTTHTAVLAEEGPQKLEMRVRQKDSAFYVTFKSRQALPTGGVAEYEELLPREVAEAFLDQVDYRLSKTRYEVPLGQGLTLEVDLFNDLGGLALAEVEIPSLDTPLPALPAWVGPEVTGQAAYLNRTLAEQGLTAGAEHEAWFRGEVEQGLREADDPTTPWVTQDHVKARSDAWRRGTGL